MIKFMPNSSGCNIPKSPSSYPADVLYFSAHLYYPSSFIQRYVLVIPLSRLKTSHEILTSESTRGFYIQGAENVLYTAMARHAEESVALGILFTLAKCTSHARSDHFNKLKEACIWSGAFLKPKSYEEWWLVLPLGHEKNRIRRALMWFFKIGMKRIPIFEHFQYQHEMIR